MYNKKRKVVSRPKKTSKSSLLLGLVFLVSGALSLYFRRYVLASGFFIASAICFGLGYCGYSPADMLLYVLFPVGALKKAILIATNGKPLARLNKA